MRWFPRAHVAFDKCCNWRTLQFVTGARASPLKVGAAPPDLALDPPGRHRIGELKLRYRAPDPGTLMPTPPSEHNLIRAKRVDETPVFNLAGARIGHVEDLSIAKISGKVIYAILSISGFLDLGETFHPLPWSMLEYDPGKGGYVVQVDKAQLEAAPAYDRDELDELGGASRVAYAERIFGYYNPHGAVPYW